MTDLKKYNKHSDTWCPIPFVGLSLHPMGFLSRCMMSEEVMSNSDEMDWDNPEFQRLRKSMLDGKWDSPGCDNCRMKEEVGAQSQRQNWLKNTIRKFPDGTYDNPQLTNNTVRHLFLNFNNVCNFKCRMCSPRYSNSLIPEHNQIVKDARQPNGTWIKPELKGLSFEEQKEGTKHKNINNVIKFLETNRHRLKDITSIWITGGEPFIDNTMFKVRDILYEYANPEQIRMSITTNGSRCSVEDISTFDKFKQIHFDLSVDSVGPMFEYMRSAGIYTWEEMHTFINELAEFREKNKDWLLVSLNSTYQLYNAHLIKEFFEYTHNMLGPEHVNMRVLVGPKKLGFQARNTPQHIKDIANKEIETLLGYSWLGDDERAMINDCKKMLNHDIIEHEWEAFKSFCKAQDNYRKVHLNEYHPMLSKEVYV